MRVFHSWIFQEGAAAVMALSPEDVRYLRHWQASIQCLPRDPDLDFIRCLRTISERIVPQLVPPMNLEEHRKQTKFSEYDEFASRVWAGYLESLINRNNKELVDIFKRVSEEVMLEQGYPNTMKLGLWVHPYKLIANVCRALATSDTGRSFLKKFVFTNEGDGSEKGEPASNGNPGSSVGVLLSRTRTKNGVSARSSPGGARRARVSAERSPRQDKTDAGVRAPEAAEGATTATAMAILATGHPTGADPVADQAAARAVVLAAEDGEARHQGRARPEAAPEEERHRPRLPLEEEAAPESEDHHSTGSADLPRG